MTPKDKALERFYKYNTIVSNEFTSDTLKSSTVALKCAITEIEEILLVNKLQDIESQNYWNEVKQELENL